MRFQFANHNPVAISPGEPNTITSTIEVSSIGDRIEDINVSIDVDHSFTSGLEISLIGPDDTRVLLVGDEGSWQDNFSDTLVFHSQNPVQIKPDQPNAFLSTIHVTGHPVRRVKLARVAVDIKHSFVQDHESDGTLLDVIVHEMGHVLGIGTLWDYFGLLQGATGDNPVFTGAQAIKEYADLHGSNQQKPVPVANTGGPGTRNGHWRESVFDTELMTGYIDPGVENPISRITAASLADLGYQVNREAADAFNLPGPAVARASVSFRRGCCTLHKHIEFKELTTNVVTQEVTVGEKLSWSVKLASEAGVTIGDSGSMEREAVLTAPAKLPKNMQNTKDLNLQLSVVDDIGVLLITSTVYNGKVEVKADKDLVILTGPLMLFGNGIKLFAGSLDKLTVQNKSQDEDAQLQILIGRKLTG